MNRFASALSPILLTFLAATLGSTGCAGNTSEDTGDSSQDLGQGVDVPNPSGAYFANITANGSGCPAGTWQAAISDDGKAFTVTFSGYEATVSPGAAMSVKDCTLAINLKTPEGLSFSVSDFHYQGYAILDQPGMTAMQSAKYYFQGNPVPATENRTNLTGPYNDSYLFSDSIGVADLVWSPCGASRTLNAQTRIVLQNNAQHNGSGYMNTSSVDGQVQTVMRFGLSWRTCGSQAPHPKQLVWQSTDGTPAVWALDATKVTAGAAVASNPGADWHLVATADVNGDGKDDFIWQHTNGTPAVWLLDGSNVIGSGAVNANPGPSWHLVTAADVDGDGKADFIWQNDNGTAAVWLIDGVNTRGGAAIGGNPGPTWHLITASDTNGDGKADFIWQNDNGTPAVWFMDGLSTTGGAAIGTNPGSSWRLVTAKDVNGDGKADLLWQNTDGTPATWFLDGSNVLGGAAIGSNPGASWRLVGASDLDGDNKADLLWQNADGTPATWLLDGATVKSGVAIGSNPGSVWRLVGAGNR
jgi:hypothetical protein